MSSDILLVAPLIFSSVVVIVATWLAIARINKDVGLTTMLGPVGWDFSSSWASTLTAVAILATLLASSDLLPDDLSLNPSKPEFGMLSLIFAFLLPMAPILYNAFRSPIRTLDGDGNITYQDQGFVWSFVLASILTVWAVGGELLSTYQLVGNITATPALILLSSGFRVGLIVVAILVVLYVCQATYALILESVDTGKAKEIRDKQLEVSVILGVLDDQSKQALRTELQTIKPPLPRWSVL